MHKSFSFPSKNDNIIAWIGCITDSNFSLFFARKGSVVKSKALPFSGFNIYSGFKISFILILSFSATAPKVIFDAVTYIIIVIIKCVFGNFEFCCMNYSHPMGLVL